jgi:hypothetical protein
LRISQGQATRSTFIFSRVTHFMARRSLVALFASQHIRLSGSMNCSPQTRHRPDLSSYGTVTSVVMALWRMDLVLRTSRFTAIHLPTPVRAARGSVRRARGGIPINNNSASSHPRGRYDGDGASSKDCQNISIGLQPEDSLKNQISIAANQRTVASGNVSHCSAYSCPSCPFSSAKATRNEAADRRGAGSRPSVTPRRTRVLTLRSAPRRTRDH